MEYDRSKASAIGAEEIVIDGSPILVASLADIIRSKQAANRPRDRAVIDVLEKALEATNQPSGASRRRRPRK